MGRRKRARSPSVDATSKAAGRGSGKGSGAGAGAGGGKATTTPKKRSGRGRARARVTATRHDLAGLRAVVLGWTSAGAPASVLAKVVPAPAGSAPAASHAFVQYNPRTWTEPELRGALEAASRAEVATLEPGVIEVPVQGGAGSGGGEAGEAAPVHYVVVGFTHAKGARRLINAKPDSDEAVEGLEGSGAEPLTKAAVLSRPTGVVGWLAEYESMGRPDVRALQEKVDTLMSAFDTQAEAKQEALERGATVDAQGFTLVSYKGRRGRTTQSTHGAAEVGTASRSKVGERRRRKKGPMELTNFYRFQARESKRDELAQLRARFTADKERVKKFQAARVFKPYR